MSHLKADSFADYIKSKDDEKKKPFKDALLFGRSEAHTDSGRSFVISCEEFFKKRGYLTEKQMNALYQVDTERLSYRADEEDYNDPSDLPNFGSEW